MVELQLTEEQAIVLAGILGITEGMILQDVYVKLIKQIAWNVDNRILADDIANLIYETLNMHPDPVINEDNLLLEAKKLNGLLD